MTGIIDRWERAEKAAEDLYHRKLDGFCIQALREELLKQGSEQQTLTEKIH